MLARTLPRFSRALFMPFYPRDGFGVWIWHVQYICGAQARRAHLLSLLWAVYSPNSDRGAPCSVWLAKTLLLWSRREAPWFRRIHYDFSGEAGVGSEFLHGNYQYMGCIMLLQYYIVGFILICSNMSLRFLCQQLCLYWYAMWLQSQLPLGPYAITIW